MKNVKKTISCLFLAATFSIAFVVPAIALAQTAPTTPPAPAGNSAATVASTAAPAAASTPASGSSLSSQLISATAGWVSGLVPVLKIWNGLFEWVFIPIASWMLALSGYMLDWTINFSLNFATQVSNAGSAIVLGWTIVRDIFNIFFIFALIYIAITTMLGETGFLGKTTLKNIIIGALLINFSFFFTEVLIDAGNVVGGWFYQGIQTTLSTVQTGQSSAPGSTSLPTPLGTGVSISAGLSGALGIFDTYNTSGVSGFLQGLTIDGATSSLISAVIRFAIIVFATYIFAYVAVLFLARTVSLLFLLVMSPIGFAGWILPITKEMAGEWKEEMEKNIMLAPAFLLYLYIIIAFVDSSLFTASNFGATGTTSAFNPTQYFKYFLLAALLLYALKKAKKFSGQLGDMVSGLAKQIASAIAGVAIGVATGGTSMALQATVGKTGANFAGSDAVQDRIKKGGFTGAVGRIQERAGLWAGSKSFDLRETKALKDTAKGIGFDIAGASKESGRAKGYLGAQKAQQKADEERTKKYTPSDANKAKLALATDAEGKTAKDRVLERELGSNPAYQNAQKNVLQLSGERMRQTGQKEQEIQMLGDKKDSELDLNKRNELDEQIQDTAKKLRDYQESMDKSIGSAVADRDKMVNEVKDLDGKTYEEEKTILDELKNKAKGGNTEDKQRAEKYERSLMDARGREVYADTVQRGTDLGRVAQEAASAAVMTMPMFTANLARVPDRIARGKFKEAAKGLNPLNAARAGVASYDKTNEKNAENIRKIISGKKKPGGDVKKLLKDIAEATGVEEEEKSEDKPEGEAKK